MWDGSSDSRRRHTSNKRKAKRTSMHMQRVPAEVQIESTKEVIDGRVFLSDLSTTGVGIFCTETLPVGDMVALVIEQPRPLYVRGKVIWCAPYTLSTKIITAETFNFRAGIKFEFDAEDQKKTVSDYIDQIAQDNEGGGKPSAPKPDDGGGENTPE